MLSYGKYPGGNIYVPIFPSKYIHEMRSPFPSPYPFPSLPSLFIYFPFSLSLNTLDILFCFLGQALAKF
ncbi:unnamed protein product [Meloidogyne enterolobii]|uniref:Uncharacterized protein n=1 Tax=Meloidogyne enterolobii TaxID=390850 RepID=A0ACB0ZP44_MELEN